MDPGPDWLLRDFARIRELAALTHETPSREWPLIFMEQHNELLVVREWPNGSITAYATSEYSDTIRRNGGLQTS